MSVSNTCSVGNSVLMYSTALKSALSSGSWLGNTLHMKHKDDRDKKRQCGKIPHQRDVICHSYPQMCVSTTWLVYIEVTVLLVPIFRVKRRHSTHITKTPLNREQRLKLRGFSRSYVLPTLRKSAFNVLSCVLCLDVVASHPASSKGLTALATTVARFKWYLLDGELHLRREVQSSLQILRKFQFFLLHHCQNKTKELFGILLPGDGASGGSDDVIRVHSELWEITVIIRSFVSKVWA